MTQLELLEAAEALPRDTAAWRPLADEPELIVSFLAFCETVSSANEVEFLLAVDVVRGEAVGLRPAGMPSGNTATLLSWIAQNFVVAQAPKEVNYENGSAQAQVQAAYASGTLAVDSFDVGYSAVRFAVVKQVKLWLSALRVQVTGPAIKMLRDSQAVKLNNPGKYAAGRYVMFRQSGDGVVVLVSSSLSKPINPDHITAMSGPLRGSDRLDGIWARELRDGKTVFTIEGKEGDAASFRNGLSKMKLNVTVEAGSWDAVNEVVSRVAPKRAGASEQVVNDKVITKELQADKASRQREDQAANAQPFQYTVKVLNTIHKDDGAETPAAAFEGGKTVINRLSPKVGQVFATTFKAATSRINTFTTQKKKSGAYWLVLHADVNRLEQHAEALGGVYLFRGDTKPLPTVNLNSVQETQGWLKLLDASDLVRVFTRT